MVILTGVKTAVSIPDDVFARAEMLAKELHISRSELYARALRKLVDDDDRITEQLNRVYGAVRPDPAVTAAARRVIRSTEW